MATPPLSREQQIAVMKGARDRRAAALARWSQNEAVQQMLRQPVSQPKAPALDQVEDPLQLRRA